MSYAGFVSQIPNISGTIDKCKNNVSNIRYSMHQLVAKSMVQILVNKKHERMKNMRKTEGFMVRFPISFSLLISELASMQSKGLTCSYTASMLLTSAKGLSCEVKE